jgi:hypothetical protein
MRLLIYAMESSGASMFCYFLGQRPGSAAIIDLWSRCLAPPLRLAVPLVAKATTTMKYRAVDHIESFAPDKFILFIRDPIAVYQSLRRYPYANTFGTIEQKLRRFDDEFGCLKPDLILRYEDFVERDKNLVEAVDALGWPCSCGYYGLARSLQEIGEFNSAASPWLKQHYGKDWGFGNIKGGVVSGAAGIVFYPGELINTVAEHSPRLSRLYGYMQGDC